MSPKKYYTFMIEPELASALKSVKEQDGIPEAEQIRRALREWFEKRKKSAPSRARARPRNG
jgi:hypothetical protein